jgi:uncharacterized Ntn-hydrolase superfamily protein
MTFSIVARCPQTGDLGVAVSTAIPAVGAINPFARARVGAIATQGWSNPYLGRDEEYPYVDLRVDEHTEPVAELRRIFDIHSALPYVKDLHPKRAWNKV